MEARENPIHLVDYDASWPELFRAERALLLRCAGRTLAEIEHIGSTAIPGLRAKPIIDLMASVRALEDVEELLPVLAEAGYELAEVGFLKRRFFRKRINSAVGAHLHVLAVSAWHHQHERLFRDWLVSHPSTAQEYERLKSDLAKVYEHDRGAYTDGKSAFVQMIVNRARQASALPAQTEWDE